jgi:flavin-dependent dehydrogenase
MRIAIAGAGIVGAYVYRLLGRKGVDAAVHGRTDGTACGTSPCAWGTSRGFCDMIRIAGLDPHKYILRRLDRLSMDEVKVQADLMTIDKPALIRDLFAGAAVRNDDLDAERYDRVIDATGVARAFLPPIEGDVTLECAQYRVRSDEPLGNRIRLGGIGYAWTFPLGEGRYHIGCGSLAADASGILDSLGWVGSGPGSGIICRCKGRVRLTSPQYSQPFVAGKVWGVGESIGCVAPLAGDGILPGLRSACLLLEHWDDAPSYTQAVLREFQWMTRERGVLDRLRSGRRPRIADGLVLKRNSRRMGMRIGIREASALVGRLT